METQENIPFPTESPKSRSPFRGSFRLFCLGTLSFFGYAYLNLLSGPELRPEAPDHWYLTRFLQTYAFLFVCYWLLITPLLRGKRMDPRHLWFAVAFGLLFRAVLLPSDLILENDIYRYLWDGHTGVQGINPYAYAPSDPKTEGYRTEYWKRINYPYVPTIYPPTLQWIFWLSELIYPGHVAGMKLMLLAFDVGVIFLLLSLLPKLNRPPEWCLVYAWSPLVIKEIANSGHADAVSAFLLVGVLWLIEQQRRSWSAATLAFLTLTKFFGALLLPLFHQIWRWRHFGLFAGMILLLYLPFLSVEVNPFQGFMKFSSEWEFNGWIFNGARRTIKQIADLDAERADRLARLLLFASVLMVVLWQSVRVAYRKEILDLFHAVFIVIGVLLICSPVVNPWYLVWMIPLLALFPNRAWILMTGLVFLSYIYYYEKKFPPWIQPVEFGIFFLFFLKEYCLPPRKPETNGS